LTSIQELGITHNDLKSPNVLLDQIQIAPGKFILKGLVFFLLVSFFAFFFLFPFSFSFSFSISHNIIKLNQLGVICDFGLARASDSSFAVKSHKQALNVYSLGIIIWEMLTRKTVWPNFSNDKIQSEVLNGNRVWIYNFFFLIINNSYSIFFFLFISHQYLK